MRLSRAIAVVERQIYLMRGSPARIVPLFGFVVIDIFLWGFITRYLDTVSTGINFVTSLLGAVVLWDFCVRVLHGVTMAFFEDVWSRNFLNIFASPLSVGEYLAGQVVSSLFTSFSFAWAFYLATVERQRRHQQAAVPVDSRV